jgi:hypothetical protein
MGKLTFRPTLVYIREQEKREIRLKRVCVKGKQEDQWKTEENIRKTRSENLHWINWRGTEKNGGLL